MQPGRGHRKAIMSIDGDYTHVGLSVVAEADPATGVGPFVSTGNYCSADTLKPNHFDRFLVGTVWRDLNGNDQYDPGEGMGGISVRPDRGAYHAVTADSGGYAMPILEAGTYTVSFSGSGISSETIRTVSVEGHSQLLDLVYINGDPGGAEAITGSASAISQRTARLNGTVNANGQDVDYYFEYGPTPNTVIFPMSSQPRPIKASPLPCLHCPRRPYTISGWSSSQTQTPSTATTAALKPGRQAAAIPRPHQAAAAAVGVAAVLSVRFSGD
jgi:hypothetical protein